MALGVLNASVKESNRPSNGHRWSLDDVPVGLVGSCSGWFQFEKDGDSVIVSPRQPLPRRCTIRPAAMFEQERGLRDVMTVMGRIVFANGTSESHRYTPFTRDPQRRLKELFLPVEAMPEDDWSMSPTRWTNHQAMAKRLLNEAGVPWNGLSMPEIERLAKFGPWAEPIEGCVLHALTGWTHGLGRCVIEIGSFRGGSSAILALALRGVGSESKVISVDPHDEFPVNAAQVRLSLTEWGEDRRLVQIVCGSDEACKLLRPGSASLIFVDGDHSYHQVVNDFENYRELLAPGGCMAFHDYGCGAHTGRTADEHEVRRAVDLHVFGNSAFKPLLLAHTLLAHVKT